MENEEKKFDIYDFAMKLNAELFEAKSKLLWTISDIKMALWELQRPCDSVTTDADKIFYALTFLQSALDRADRATRNGK